MAQLLAPYNNSMRLGQGFNSYTQQICLDKAVVPDGKARRPEQSTAITITEPLDIETDYDDAAVQLSTSSSEEGAGISEMAQDLERRAAMGNDKEYRPRPFVVQPWNVPQIVTYSSTFVDKVSDVTGTFSLASRLVQKAHSKQIP